MSVKFSVFGNLDVERRMAVMQLPPRKRRQLLGGIGREIKRQSVRNLRAAKGVDGTPWESRKRGPGRKLLKRLNRQVKANFTTPDFVEVGFHGGVAYQQHEGFTKVMNAAAVQQETDGKDEKEKATRRQAKALRDEGFKIRVKGTKKWRKPSLSWIETNLHKKQAGLILRTLRKEVPKKSWKTTIPSRTFLGASQPQIDRFVQTIYDNTINSRV